jgi:transcription elongation GreA/GreB family factor
MTSSSVLQAILTHLTAELEALTRAAKDSYSAATDPDSRAENKYDTRTLEASYVARGQAVRVADMTLALEQFRALEGMARSEVARLGSLVRLETPKETMHCFIGPAAGGTQVQVGCDTVDVVTPASPLGQKLLQKLTGDKVLLSPGYEAVVRAVR